MDLIAEIVGLSAALTEAGVEYAVCGGVALAIHGHPRFTRDIDILIRADDLDRALAAVARRGFMLEGGKLTFRTGSPDQRTIFRVSRAQGPHLLVLDLLISGKEHDLAGRHAAPSCSRDAPSVWSRAKGSSR